MINYDVSLETESNNKTIIKPKKSKKHILIIEEEKKIIHIMLKILMTSVKMLNLLMSILKNA